jgi:tRNA(Arg) A34 adenosine deaminase TadA
VDKIVAQFANDVRFKGLEDAVRQVLASSDIRNITEYTRAVHAEMDAILAAARSASGGLVGSTLYVTDYPCHNCAKHIICAGLARVVYLQPYEKSLARKLHPDAINDPLMDPSPCKATFDIYGGVAPHRFQDLFRMKQERKVNGLFIDRDRARHSLRPGSLEPIKELMARVKSEPALEDQDGREN